MTRTGAVVWLTGLPASGKTTLARHVRDLVGADRCIVLDSDDVRDAISATGYSDAARTAFYRSLGGLAQLLAGQGFVVLVAATAPRRAHRDFGRGAAPFLEVYVATPLVVCEARDPKGLYADARRDRASTLPGVGEPYEPPLAPAVVVEPGDDAAPHAIARALAGAEPRAQSS